MSVVAGGYRRLNLREDRVCRFYISYLRRVKRHQISESVKDPLSCREVLQDILRLHYSNKEARNALVLEMEEVCKNSLIPSSEFAWMKSDFRACYWVWGCLMTSSLGDLGYLEKAVSKPEIPDGKVLFEEVVYNKCPSNANERLEAIIEFFDLWQVAAEMKGSVLQELKKIWGKIYNFQDPFKWIEKNDKDQCEWAWEYIRNSSSLLPCSVFNPVTSEDRYYSIYAAFDVWDVHSDTRKLFLLNFKKAWDQKKYRSRQVGRKPLNTYLKEGTKKKLDTLARQRGQKIHETLEWLIDQEHDNSGLPLI